METEHEISPLRQKILDLASEGKIKQKKATIMKSSEENLEKIYKDYELKQLDDSLCQLADIMIKKFSELLETLDAIKDGPAMEKDLASNDLLRKDLKNIIGHVTPYVSMIGILSGGLTVGKHVVINMAENERVKRATTEGSEEEDVTKIPATG